MGEFVPALSRETLEGYLNPAGRDGCVTPRVVETERRYAGYVTVERRTVELDPDGPTVAFDVAGHPGAGWTAVYVVPWHTSPDGDDSVTLVSEYHQGAGRRMLGCVAGAFDPARHGDAEGAARAEMSEEARLAGGLMVPLMHSGARLPELKWSGNAVHPLLCLDPAPDPSPGAPDPEELGLTPVRVPVRELPGLFCSGALNGASVACLSLAMLAMRGRAG